MNGTLRRECPLHFIVFNEGHLRGILLEYVRHYTRMRPHRSLALDSPEGRPSQRRPPSGRVQSRPNLGGLHHEYQWAARHFAAPRGILWAPEGASGARPLVLVCHGGSQEKRAPNVLALARSLVRHLGYAVVSRSAGIALLEAFASTEKSMHINPGGHVDVPAFELNAWERFFLRHLDRATG